MSEESIQRAIREGYEYRARGEIYGVQDWSPEEQFKHMMSCPGPGEKQPFDWFGFWLYTTAVIAGCVVAAIIWAVLS